jgi:hypothetical protein
MAQATYRSIILTPQRKNVSGCPPNTYRMPLKNWDWEQ